MPASDHPRFTVPLSASTEPSASDLSVGRPLPSVEDDRQVLSWLQCSPQLSSEVKGYLVDALLDGTLNGRGYPQMKMPDGGPDGDHLQVLQQIIARLPQRIAEAQGVSEKLELGRAGRLLSRALWAASDPQGVQESVERELLADTPGESGAPAQQGRP